MELEKSKLKHKKKKLGKCFDCSHRRFNRYCMVREEAMYNDYLWDKLIIKFCKYYEPIIKCPCGEQGEEGTREVEYESLHS